MEHQTAGGSRSDRGNAWANHTSARPVEPARGELRPGERSDEGASTHRDREIGLPGRSSQPLVACTSQPGFAFGNAVAGFALILRLRTKPGAPGGTRTRRRQQLTAGAVGVARRAKPDWRGWWAAYGRLLTAVGRVGAAEGRDNVNPSRPQTVAAGGLEHDRREWRTGRNSNPQPSDP